MFEVIRELMRLEESKRRNMLRNEVKEISMGQCICLFISVEFEESITLYNLGGPQPIG